MTYPRDVFTGAHMVYGVVVATTVSVRKSQLRQYHDAVRDGDVYHCDLLVV